MDKLNINAIDASPAPKDDNIEFILGFSADGELKATTITAQSSDTYDKATIDAKDTALRQHIDVSISDLIGGATPEALDTLSELAAALQKDGDAIVAINNELSTKYSPTNKPSAADVGTYTKSEIDSKDSLKLDKSGGTITGIIHKDTGHGTFLSGGEGFADLLGINDTGNAGGAYFGKDGYWLRSGNASNQPKVVRSGTEYAIYHQGFKPKADEIGALVANYLRGTPAAAYYGTFGQGMEGTKIRLPWTPAQGQMVSFTVRVYQSYKSYDVQFSGYLYETPNNWYEPRAILMASTATQMSVRMGRDDDGRVYVWLEGGHYRGVGVFDVVIGYKEGDATQGWEISESDHTPNLAYDQVIYPPYSKHNLPSAVEIGALPTTGGILSGPVSANALGVNQTDGLDGLGLSLYAGSRSANPEYGVFFGQTSKWGGFGQVDGDWATYNTMTGGDRRGWVFRHNDVNVASINSQGHGTFNEVLTNGRVTINGNSNSFMAMDSINYGSGWNYIQLKSGNTVSHIAHNNEPAAGAEGSSLHLRPNGVQLGSLALQPDAQMLHQTQHGWIKIGSINPSWAHFSTDRPQYHFDKTLGVAGEIYAGGNYDQRVYHQGFKPTAAEIGAHEVKPWTGDPAMDANQTGNYSAFTYANNAPLNGSIVSLGNPSYCMQFNSNYGGTPYLYFRTHNGDVNAWNEWRKVAMFNSDDTFSHDKMVRGTNTGSDYTTCGLETYVDAGAPHVPSISFHKGGHYAGMLDMRADGQFGLTNGSGSAFASLSLQDLSAAGSITGGVINAIGNITGNEVYARSWLRTYNSAGWFNETHGGGIHMEDSVWVRIYNGKKFHVSNTEYDSINTSGGIKASGNLDINAISARGRITSSSGFSGNGSGLTDVPFGQVKATEHLLFNDPAGLNGGNFVLSQPFYHYKALVFYTSDDSSRYMYSMTKTVEEINRLQSFGKPYGIMADSSYFWNGRFAADGRTFVTTAEAARVWQVIGLT